MMKIPAIEDAKNGEQPDVEDPAGQWVILYPEDYNNMMVDGEDNLAFLIKSERQARELERLATKAREWFEQEDGDSDAA